MPIPRRPAGTAAAVLALLTLPPIEGYAQAPGAYSLNLPEVVNAAVSGWTRDSDVSVPAELRSSLLNSFREQEPYLKPIVATQGLTAEQQDRLATALVRSYLYEVRDMRFNYIRAEDLNRFGLQPYLWSVFPPGRGGRRPEVGYLTVSSNPPKAEITIDSAPKGFTEKEFVLSTGNHTIRVISGSNQFNCETRLLIEKDKTKTYTCPE